MRDRGFRIAQKERVIRNRVRQVRLSGERHPYIRYVNQLTKKKPYDCGTPGCSSCARPPSKEKQIAADKAFQEALADAGFHCLNYAEYFGLVG